MSNPFDLNHDGAYRSWRKERLRAYPEKLTNLRIEIGRLATPSATERAAVLRCIGIYNMALIRTHPSQIEPESILEFGRALGLKTADSNLFADHRAVSTISPGGSGERADYIPYTNKPLSWHTDGYYNSPENQVRAWTLFCAHASPSGGANLLLDHEIAYILLREASVAHIKALSHPQTFTIPANVKEGRIIRAESAGPVFSVRDSTLHMRYSARSRHVQWRDTPEAQAARDAMDRLFSLASNYTFTHTLQPGEGLISNNVLHNRTGFPMASGSNVQRLLYRVRYTERVATASPD